MSFWPTDIFFSGNESPREIMYQAGIELQEGTKKLTVLINETILSDRIVLAFIVQNNEHKIQFNVFEAMHQIMYTYPVAIEPPTSDIPDFLKRHRKIRGGAGLISTGLFQTSIIGGMPDRIVENEWISVTPQEFKDKLKKVLALDFVKSNIVSLLAPKAITTSAAEETRSEELQELEDESEELGENEANQS